MSSNRHMLPYRRPSQTFEMMFGQQRTVFSVTIGYYDRTATEIGEVFISGAKAGSEMDAIARDGAVLLSLAIQHGVPLKTIQHAITREANGKASTIIGAVIDRITE